ncbi:hypothetical protein, partial [Asanoa siamensis]|uniref:hypothetical protein n=1 Tax=Asanoa siamensis TaxID=926357 RepID=UPI0019420B3D
PKTTTRKTTQRPKTTTREATQRPKTGTFSALLLPKTSRWTPRRAKAGTRVAGQGAQDLAREAVGEESEQVPRRSTA